MGAEVCSRAAIKDSMKGLGKFYVSITDYIHESFYEPAVGRGCL